MARDERDREDLLREATALVRRAEFRTISEPETIVAGFRRAQHPREGSPGDGPASFFFGATAFHFNEAKELRRAYVADSAPEGALLKAEAGRLVRLVRKRTASEVQLVREELSDAEGRAIAGSLLSRLRNLQTDLFAGRYTLLGEVPTGGGAVNGIIHWIGELPEPIQIAIRPNA